MRRWLAAWLPAVLWAGVIFGASSIPGTQIPSVDLPQAELLGWRHWRRQAGVAVLIATLYGVSDEIHQHWTPNRTPDWHDVVADALGGGLGTLALVAMRWMKIRACLMMGRSKS